MQDRKSYSGSAGEDNGIKEAEAAGIKANGRAQTAIQ